jgi:flagellar biogenesis protein FliO
MTRSLMILAATSLLLAVFFLPPKVMAEDAVAKAEGTSGSSVVDSSSKASPGVEAEASDALSDKDTIARIKEAHNNLKRKPEVEIEAPAFSPATSPYMKNGAYFFAALLLGLSLYKRFRGAATADAAYELIEVVSRKALSSRASLLLVKVQNQSILLSQNNEEIRFLTALEPQQNFEQTMAGVSLREHAKSEASEARSVQAA